VVFTKRLAVAFILLSISNVFVFFTANAAQKETSKPAKPDSTWVEQTLASMTLDEKVGQLIIPAVVGMFLSQDSETFQQIRRDITEFHVGGYHMLGEVNILHEPAGVALLINHLQELARVPLWITADFEGGVGLRYIGATRLPRAMAMGATGNPEMAYQAARITAEEARALGVQVNFYPVADVNNNARNPIINIRSFGGDPKQVGLMARAYIRGSQEHGVMATAKHFPGHGDTSTDSHLELPVVDVDRARLNSIELPPFRAAIEEGVGGVMSAHIALPQIETERLPATLSPKMLTGVLRGELKFNGVIFTDALNMRGIAAHYPEGEAAVRAIKAGADVLLYPPSVEQAFIAVKHAVESGEIKEARIDESVRRILSAKANLGIDRDRFVDIGNLDKALGTIEHQRTAQQIIENAITLVRDTRSVLPLKLSPEQKVLFISMVDNSDGWRDGVPGSSFFAGLVKRHPKSIHVYVTDKTSPAEFELITKLASFSDAVIVNAFIRVASFKGSIDMSDGEINLLKHLSATQQPFAFVLFGSPYLLSFVPELPTYVLAYEYYPAAEEASLKAVLGEIEFKGRLPIDLPGFYPIGHSATKTSETKH
jgi:beta-N-acetylhexosaminidase